MLLNNYRLIDISPTISSQIGVFPGDATFERLVSLSFENKNHLLLSSISTTLHLGAHADAPSHYHPKGEGIDTRDLDFYVGDCQVIDVSHLCGLHLKKERLMKADILSWSITSKKVLFKTMTFPDPDAWNEDFIALDPHLIAYLYEKGVRTIGLDTPSVDPQNCQDLIAHHMLYEKNMAVIEGLVLNHVTEGQYFLSAAPLKIKDADAGPLRAFLIQF